MVLADTGFWLALADRRDRHHEVAVAAFSRLREPLITTWPVMTETCYLLLTKLGIDSQRRFLETYAAGGFQVFPLEVAHAPRLLELTEKYRDLPMDLADASLVVLAEHLGQGRILSTDQRDFRSCRFKHTRPFKNLLLP